MCVLAGCQLAVCVACRIVLIRLLTVWPWSLNQGGISWLTDSFLSRPHWEVDRICSWGKACIPVVCISKDGFSYKMTDKHNYTPSVSLHVAGCGCRRCWQRHCLRIMLGLLVTSSWQIKHKSSVRRSVNAVCKEIIKQCNTGLMLIHKVLAAAAATKRICIDFAMETDSLTWNKLTCFTGMCWHLNVSEGLDGFCRMLQ